jgi:vibriolysin
MKYRRSTITIYSRAATALIGCLILILPVGAVLAAEDDPQTLLYAPYGTPAWVSGSLYTFGLEDIEAEEELMLPALAERYLSGTGLEDFELTRSELDNKGVLHLRFDQYIDGYRVHGAELLMHVDSKSGELQVLNGRYASADRVVPSKSWPMAPEEAFRAALKPVDGVIEATYREPELVYNLDDLSGETRLAWHTVAVIREGESTSKDLLLADAETGDLLRRQSQIIHGTVEIWDNQHKYLADLPGVFLFEDDDCATWPKPTGCYDQTAVDAHANTTEVNQFFSQVFGRSALSCNGLTLKTSIHYGNNYNNAGYDAAAKTMYYGDGQSNANPWGSGFDVVAHEMTHGISDCEGLGYISFTRIGQEVGAVQESLSDIFAAIADRWRNEQNGCTTNCDSGVWTVFESINRILRYLNNPASDGVSEDFYLDLYDKSGASAHYAGGISNLAYYLLVNGGYHPRGKTSNHVNGIGMNAARQVVHDAYPYLSSSAGFHELRLAMKQASTWDTNIDAAFRAVGVFDDVEGPRQYVDTPYHNQVLSAPIIIQGWATDASQVKTLTFKVDGQTVSLPDLDSGIHRSGVCTAHADLDDPDCPYVGWNASFYPDDFADGQHTLEVHATDKRGNLSVYSRSFSIDTSQVRTFKVSEDAYVSQVSPTFPYGKYDRMNLRTRSTQSGQGLSTYLKFYVNVNNIASAKLRIKTGSYTFPSSRIYYMQSSSWSENTITWNNAPLAFYFQYAIGSLLADTWQEIDVSSIVTRSGWYTLGLTAADSPNLYFLSKETGSTPSLVVTLR